MTTTTDRAALTCALPMFKSGGIGWLALESLCRQRDIDFEWELIVCEERRPRLHRFENNYAMGEAAVREYESRLADVGCRTPITYTSLRKWVPLSDKWAMMSENANSDGLLLVAADCYSQPRRLVESHRLFQGGAEWIQSPLGPFYDIVSDIVAIYDYELSTCRAALNMGIRTDVLKGAPHAGKRSGVDNWMFGHATERLGRIPVVGVNTEPSWSDGVDTHGMNNISRYRGKMLGRGLIPHDDGSPRATAPWRPPHDGEPKRIDDCVPADIADRLRSLQSLAERRNFA